jgi:hypothetical protein
MISYSTSCAPVSRGPQNSMSNRTFYPALLASLFWVFSPPLVPLLGLIYAWQRHREPIGRYTLAVLSLSLLLFLFYHYQGSRFMAGPATLLLVVWLADLVGNLGRRWRPPRGHITLGAPAPSSTTIP